MRLWLGWGLASILAVGEARAQDADSYDVSGSSMDGQAAFQLIHPRLGQKQGYVGLQLSHSARPLVGIVDRGDGPEEISVVAGQTAARIAGGVNLLERARFDIEIPLYLANVVNGESRFDLGDVRVGAVVVLVRPKSLDRGFALSLAPGLTLPSAGPGSFLSSGFSGRLVVTGGARHGAFGWLANVGVVGAPAALLASVPVGSKLSYGVGANFTMADESFNVGVELNGEGGLASGFAAGTNTLEGQFFWNWTSPMGLGLRMGVGKGIIGGVGSPNARLAGGLSYSFGSAKPAPKGPKPDGDEDQDGVINANDKCPEPEDRDGWLDEDGCPDQDNDGDGIFDVMEECDNEAEDFDGWQDEDGCFDLDDDLDGVPDAKDTCPRIAGPPELDGCPDTDSDGLLDGDDQCPTEVGTFDTMGCPDRDGDGVPDKDDACPDKKGKPEKKGCR